jgi:hypothetical protein
LHRKAVSTSRISASNRSWSWTSPSHHRGTKRSRMHSCNRMPLCI